LDATAEAALKQVLAEDPQARGYRATDWTVPLLSTELARHGHILSERTLRRTVHRLGLRWKRPKGRPDPASAAKKGRV
jgi:transposase